MTEGSQRSDARPNEQRCPHCGTAVAEGSAGHACQPGQMAAAPSPPQAAISRPRPQRTDPLLGHVIDGRYEIMQRIGRGGMGAVYRAQHVQLGSPFAVKVLLHPQREQERVRFLQEARIASRIHHPNTVNIVDYGLLPDGHPYLVMEYLKGSTLASVLQQGPLPFDRACRIAIQIAHGLHAVHKQDVVHRDLKPENIFLLQEEGRPDFVKIVDFGIAKAPLGQRAAALAQAAANADATATATTAANTAANATPSERAASSISAATSASGAAAGTAATTAANATPSERAASSIASSSAESGASDLDPSQALAHAPTSGVTTATPSTPPGTEPPSHAVATPAGESSMADPGIDPLAQTLAAQDAALWQSAALPQGPVRNLSDSTVPAHARTQAWEILGTPYYLSPEQAKGSTIDGRADQYSLGCILFEMLSGRVPFEAETLPALLYLHLFEPPPPLHVPPSLPSPPPPLTTAIHRMLAKDAGGRFGSMAEVAGVLEGVLAPRGRSRSGWWWGVGALALLGGVGLLQGWRSRAPAADLPPSAHELKQARQQALSVLTADLQRGFSDARHAAVEAAGWAREPSLREPLEALLGSQDATLSTHVAEALSKLGEPQAAPRLRDQLHQNAPGLDWQRARLASAYALSKLGDAEGREVLRSALQGPPSSAPRLGLGLAQDARAQERIAAALLLCDSDEAEAQSLLSQIAAAPSTPFSTVLEILSCQARGSQSPAALQALRSRLRASQGKDRLAVAARLAALGDGEARELLREQLTSQTLPRSTASHDALLAARALAGADEPLVLPLLRRTLQRGGVDATARTLASEALGLCGELSDIRLLKQQLDLFDSPPLRQTSAAAILLLSALENDALSQAGLRWARSAMGDSNLTTRLAAIAALGHSQQTDSLLLLAQALRDPLPTVRQGAIRALAQRRSEAALRLMRHALQDANSEVRQATLHAIVGVLRSFGPEGMGGLLAEALGWIAQTAQGTPEWWVDAARIALGDKGRTEALAQLQAQSDPGVQLWLIELGLVSHDALLRGTASPDSQLALAAARALAKQDPAGSRDAILQVANRLQAQGGRSLLDAAGLQISVGDTGRAVAILQDAAHSLDPALRMSVLDIVAGLPAAARVHLRPLLQVLVNDPVLGLRAYAAGLLTQERGAVIARDEQAPGLVGAAFEAGTQMEGSKDAGAIEEAKPDLGPGEVERAAPTPAQPSEEDAAHAAQRQKQERLAQAQALFDQASQSAEAGDSSRRTKLLLRARSLCASASLRSHPDCVVLTAAATATLAGLYEQDARFTEAMSEYQLLLNNSSDTPAVVAHKRDAQKATVRMGLRLGRVIVHTESGGRCREIVYWLAPGKGTVRVGAAQEEVDVRAGDVLHRGKCP